MSHRASPSGTGSSPHRFSGGTPTVSEPPPPTSFQRAHRPEFQAPIDRVPPHMLQYVKVHTARARYDLATEKFFTGTNVVQSKKGVHVRCLALVGEDSIWVGEKSGSISVWHMPTNELITRTESLRDVFVWCMLEVGAHVWVGFSDGLVRVYDGNSMMVLKEIKEHAGGVHCLVPYFNNTCVFTGSADFAINQWDVVNCERVGLFSGHKNAVRTLCVHGRRLFSGGDDSQLIEWDVVSRKPIRKVKDHDAPVRCLTVTATNLWSGSEDGSVRIYSLQQEVTEAKATVGDEELIVPTSPTTQSTLQCLHIIRSPHRGPVSFITRVGHKVWTAALGTVFVFDSTSFALEGQFQEHKGYVTSLAAVQQSVVSRVWTCGAEGEIRAWNTESSWAGAKQWAQSEHVSTLESLLEEAEEKEADLRSTKNLVEDEAKFLQDENTQLMATNDALMNQNDALKNENEELKHELEASVMKIDELTTEKTQAEERLAALDEQEATRLRSNNLRQKRWMDLVSTGAKFDLPTDDVQTQQDTSAEGTTEDPTTTTTTTTTYDPKNQQHVQQLEASVAALEQLNVETTKRLEELLNMQQGNASGYKSVYCGSMDPIRLRIQQLRDEVASLSLTAASVDGGALANDDDIRFDAADLTSAEKKSLEDIMNSLNRASSQQNEQGANKSTASGGATFEPLQLKKRRGKNTAQQQQEASREPSPSVSEGKKADDIPKTTVHVTGMGSVSFDPSKLSTAQQAAFARLVQKHHLGSKASNTMRGHGLVACDGDVKALGCLSKDELDPYEADDLSRIGEGTASAAAVTRANGVLVALNLPKWEDMSAADAALVRKLVKKARSSAGRTNHGAEDEGADVDAAEPTPAGIAHQLDALSATVFRFKTDAQRREHQRASQLETDIDAVAAIVESTAAVLEDAAGNTRKVAASTSTTDEPPRTSVDHLKTLTKAIETLAESNHQRVAEAAAALAAPLKTVTENAEVLKMIQHDATSCTAAVVEGQSGAKATQDRLAKCVKDSTGSTSQEDAHSAASAVKGLVAMATELDKMMKHTEESLAATQAAYKQQQDAAASTTKKSESRGHHQFVDVKTSESTAEEGASRQEDNSVRADSSSKSAAQTHDQPSVSTFDDPDSLNSSTAGSPNTRAWNAMSPRQQKDRHNEAIESLRSTKNELAELKKENAALRQELMAAKEELADAAKKHEQEMEDVHKKYRQTILDMTNSEEPSEEQVALVASLRDEVRALQNRIDAANAQRGSSESLKMQVAELEEQLGNELRKQKTADNADALRHANEELTAALKEAKEEVAQLKQHVKNQDETFGQELKRKESLRAEAAEGSLARARSQVNLNETLSKQYDDLVEENSNLRKELLAKDDLAAALDEEHATTVQRLEDDRDAQLAEKEAELAELRERVDTLESQVSIQPSNSDAKNLKRQVDDLEEALSSTRKSLMEERTMREDAYDQDIEALARATEETEDLQHRIKVLEKALRDAEGENETLANLCAKSEDRRKTQEAEMNTLKQELSNARVASAQASAMQSASENAYTVVDDEADEIEHVEQRAEEEMKASNGAEVEDCDHNAPPLSVQQDPPTASTDEKDEATTVDQFQQREDERNQEIEELQKRNQRLHDLLKIAQMRAVNAEAAVKSMKKAEENTTVAKETTNADVGVTTTPATEDNKETSNSCSAEQESNAPTNAAEKAPSTTDASPRGGLEPVHSAAKEPPVDEESQTAKPVIEDASTNTKILAQDIEAEQRAEKHRAALQEELRTQIENLQQMVTETRREVREARDDEKKAREELRELVQKEASTASEKEQKENERLLELLAAREKLHEVEEQHRDLRDELRDVKADKDANEHQAAHTIEDLRATIDSLEKDLRALQDSATKQSAAAKKDADEREQDLAYRNHELTSQAEELRMTSEEAAKREENANEQLSVLVEQAVARDEEVSQLQEALQQAQQEAAESRPWNEKLKALREQVEADRIAAQEELEKAYRSANKWRRLAKSSNAALGEEDETPAQSPTKPGSTTATDDSTTTMSGGDSRDRALTEKLVNQRVTDLEMLLKAAESLHHANAGTNNTTCRSSEPRTAPCSDDASGTTAQAPQGESSTADTRSTATETKSESGQDASTKIGLLSVEAELAKQREVLLLGEIQHLQHCLAQAEAILARSSNDGTKVEDDATLDALRKVLQTATANRSGETTLPPTDSTAQDNAVGLGDDPASVDGIKTALGCSQQMLTDTKRQVATLEQAIQTLESDLAGQRTANRQLREAAEFLREENQSKDAALALAERKEDALRRNNKEDYNKHLVKENHDLHVEVAELKLLRRRAGSIVPDQQGQGGVATPPPSGPSTPVRPMSPNVSTADNDQTPQPVLNREMTLVEQYKRQRELEDEEKERQQKMYDTQRDAEIAQLQALVRQLEEDVRSRAKGGAQHSRQKKLHQMVQNMEKQLHDQRDNYSGKGMNKPGAGASNEDLIDYYEEREEMYRDIGRINQQLHAANAEVLTESSEMASKLRNLSYIFETRPTLIRALLELYKCVSKVPRYLEGQKKYVSQRQLSLREARKLIDDISEEVGIVKEGNRWIVANLFTAFELQHLGASPSNFVPDVRRPTWRDITVPERYARLQAISVERTDSVQHNAASSSPAAQQQQRRSSLSTEGGPSIPRFEIVEFPPRSTSPAQQHRRSATPRAGTTRSSTPTASSRTRLSTPRGGAPPPPARMTAGKGY